MRVDEPCEADVERTIKSLRLVLALIKTDPLAAGARNLVEATFGVNLAHDLSSWLRRPDSKRELRNKFIERMKSIWS